MRCGKLTTARPCVPRATQAAPGRSADDRRRDSGDAHRVRRTRTTRPRRRWRAAGTHRESDSSSSRRSLSPHGHRHGRIRAIWNFSSSTIRDPSIPIHESPCAAATSPIHEETVTIAITEISRRVTATSSRRPT
ncbi:hypothetical protein RPB_1333 [Rhodopseudomonas palustris HaA2]|uniref:Uncharacterized protein n=1 Tax=Rhodopseudomonas palustris (strain HaA2) TaxID=316058 RepID=Q2J0G7_RHOP2|nr:hypothetical protein RPB_1333 [Rhodopseudomonas palustris HaA2]